MASNYDKARKFLRDNPVWGIDRKLAEAGVYASLAVADEVRALRESLTVTDETLQERDQ